MALEQQRSDEGSIALPDLVMTVSSSRGHRLPIQDISRLIGQGGELRTAFHFLRCLTLLTN